MTHYRKLIWEDKEVSFVIGTEFTLIKFRGKPFHIIPNHEIGFHGKRTKKQWREIVIHGGGEITPSDIVHWLDKNIQAKDKVE